SQLSSQMSLELFYAFSSHSFTRSSMGWLHEKKMHFCMCAGSEPFCIFGDQQQLIMQPSALLFPGMAAGIKYQGPSNSYYWLPSVMNFPGIDGVLGHERDIYTLQASTAADHGAPLDGILRIWDAVSPEVQKQCTWHFVVIADDERTAETLRAKFAKQLVNVQVWGCNLNEHQPNL
ncbi:hypothetical protein BT96DRAFT_1036312, partial [Gymnopus androsaceus JB14]